MATQQTNKFTKYEFVAYKLQIWQNTFNACLQASGGRDVTMATRSANEAVEAFVKLFEKDIEGKI
jgi:hypothetical protein